MQDEKCKNFYNKKKSLIKDSNREIGRVNCYKSQNKNSKVHSSMEEKTFLKSVKKYENSFVDQTKTCSNSDNYEYVINSDILPSAQTLNVYYDKDNRIRSYTVKVNSSYDVDSQSNIELDPVEANAVEVLTKLTNIDKRGLNWNYPQDILTIKYSNFRLPPADLATTFLRCKACNTKPSYSKISDLCLASKLGQFDELFKDLGEEIKSEEEPLRSKEDKKPPVTSNVGGKKRGRKKKSVNEKNSKLAAQDRRERKVKRLISSKKELLDNAGPISEEESIKSDDIPNIVDPSVPLQREAARSNVNEVTISMTEIEDSSIESTNTEKRILSKEKTFLCKICGSSFTSSFGMKYHISKVHTAEKDSIIKPFSCPVEDCHKKYKNKNGLKYHLKHKHEIEE